MDGRASQVPNDDFLLISLSLMLIVSISLINSSITTFCDMVKMS